MNEHINSLTPPASLPPSLPPCFTVRRAKLHEVATTALVRGGGLLALSLLLRAQYVRREGGKEGRREGRGEVGSEKTGGKHTRTPPYAFLPPSPPAPPVEKEEEQGGGSLLFSYTLPSLPPSLPPSLVCLQVAAIGGVVRGARGGMGRGRGGHAQVFRQLFGAPAQRLGRHSLRA